MIEYGSVDDLWYDETCEEVRHYVVASGRRVLCRISREALTDSYGDTGDGQAFLDLAKANFDPITNIWGHKITLGVFEPDGTVFIRSSESS